MLFSQNKNKITGFTLIELLIVIVIIGILAVALIPRLTGAQATARDASRKASLHQLQSALELYHNDKGSYPTTNGVWRGVCATFGSHSTTGSNGYVPNLAPEYMTVLPTDPKPTGPDTCYLYRSDSVDYNILAFQTVEGKIPDDLKRHVWPYERTYSVYTSPAAKMW